MAFCFFGFFLQLDEQRKKIAQEKHDKMKLKQVENKLTPQINKTMQTYKWC